MSYKCEILADSLSPQGNRLTTFKVTYPRIIHAEMCRHRMLSRNTASSRAIPFEKMVKDVQENPFIPLAWQKSHKGMQGTEYLSKTDKFNLSQFVSVMIDTLNNMTDKNSKEFKQFEKEVKEKVNLVTGLLSKYTHLILTLDEWWLLARDKAVEAASILYVFGATKQLLNRLMEAFVWTTELVSGTERENFFSLRCPKYTFGELTNTPRIWRSRKDAIIDFPDWESRNDLFWLSINKSQAEIHIQKIAEMMWDCYNESKPKTLQSGEWHIPYGDNISNDVSLYSSDVKEQTRLWGKDLTTERLKIATARAARISYTTLGDNPKIDYEADIKLHDRLLESKHLSCFEHCARAMSEEEYDSFIKGKVKLGLDTSSGGWGGPPNTTYHPNKNTQGWCNNFQGFIQYRYLIENKND